jgi:hypothetical protein
LALAGGKIAASSVAHNYKDSYAQDWNFNIQQQLTADLGLMVGYFGSKGTDLNIRRNYNQLVNGVAPYPTLSANSPIFPGKPLSTIQVYESDGNSSYNALWVTGSKHFSRGFQFETSYTFSKSIDYNSRNVQGTTVQDSNNIRGDRGLSDFDARHRVVFSGLYDLPFHGNRFKEGWELATIVQLQSGNPINFRTTNSTLTGQALIRPSVSGPVQVSFSPATDGNATHVTYIQNPGVFYCGVPGNVSCTGALGAQFGNLGRNVIIGPGFSNVDLALVKNTKLTEHITWQIRADAFDLLNHPNFSQPGASATADSLGSSTFNMLIATRVPPGDSGSSRQMQLAMKLIF